MDSELVQNFCAVTGSDPSVAAGYLQVADNNVEQAVALFFENGGKPLQHHGDIGAGSPSGIAGGSDADDVRAPIAAHRDVLVDDYGSGSRMHGIYQSGYGGYSRSGYREVSSSIFAQRNGSGHVPFRDFAQEAAEMAGDDSAAPTLSRRDRLAELFKPPFDIMHVGDFESARQSATRSGKWLLVNIQDLTDFRCQSVNRDIWRHDIIKDVVKKYFVFFQIAVDTVEGSKLASLYNAGSFPFIAAIDPKTGEMKYAFTRVSNTDDVLDDVMSFTSAHPLGAVSTEGSGSSSGRASAQAGGAGAAAAGRAVHDMTEDEQLAAAIAASELESRGPPASSANAIPIGSDSEMESDDYDSDDYSEIHTISSSSYSLPDADDIDVEQASSAHEQMAASAASAAAPEPEHAPAAPSPDSWYLSLSESEAAEPPLGPAVTRIQFRLPDGRRTVRRFLKSERVVSLFQYLKSTLPDARTEVPEVLFMRSRLAEVLDQTIEEAKLINASVTVDI
ncbi:hypothetical protein GQ54DRAFT_305610 [Martensiomyces pterosporus]|nr:hypothetical protein GQ54DRAFT_305610 [Martensiomyces pterosporus]